MEFCFFVSKKFYHSIELRLIEILEKRLMYIVASFLECDRSYAEKIELFRWYEMLHRKYLLFDEIESASKCVGLRRQRPRGCAGQSDPMADLWILPIIPVTELVYIIRGDFAGECLDNWSTKNIKGTMEKRIKLSPQLHNVNRFNRIQLKKQCGISVCKPVQRSMWESYYPDGFLLRRLLKESSKIKTS